ncbi:MAG: hypothetical protein P1P89_01375 [Desulfobacterales bacterium]|nr:hypothetical protein [Desulfobacterales bacterium]
MPTTHTDIAVMKAKRLFILFAILIGIGLAAFFFGLLGQNPQRAWQAYLINFLIWSGIAQGALLFSTVMHTTKARWSGALSSAAESFSAFFPISFILFLLLFLGKEHVFPWLHHDLHGKEVWLNLPFLFARDILGLLILYGFGFAYLYYALCAKIGTLESRGKIRTRLSKHWVRIDPRRCQSRQSIFSILYMLAFALVLSLVGFDLVMSMDPHWHSTLFGAYTFVKAFYIGLGGLIILAWLLYLKAENRFGLRLSDFHDIGKLFFAFCLMWADFFYVQLVVIWYGNIPELTGYIIERTLMPPWKMLAWTVFIVCFILPFLLLLNKKIKTKPWAMIPLCSIVIVGIWLEHLLLLGPALGHDTVVLPLSLTDGLISLGFLGLLLASVAFFLKLFPELGRIGKREGVE